MIVAETDKRFFKRYDDYESVLKIFDDRSVDMLIYTSDELASISHRPFIEKILEEGHIIYEC